MKIVRTRQRVKEVQSIRSRAKLLGTGGFRNLKHKSQGRTVTLGEIKNRLNWT